MNFFDLDIKTKNMIFSDLLSSFDDNKSYYLLISDEWDGWKPETTFDVYRIIKDLYKSLINNDRESNNDYWVGSGGFSVGYYYGVLYISFDLKLVKNNLYRYHNINKCIVSSSINISDYLRRNKLTKIKTKIYEY